MFTSQMSVKWYYLKFFLDCLWDWACWNVEWPFRFPFLGWVCPCPSPLPLIALTSKIAFSSLLYILFVSVKWPADHLVCAAYLSPFYVVCFGEWKWLSDLSFSLLICILCALSKKSVLYFKGIKVSAFLSKSFRSLVFYI